MEWVSGNILIRPNALAQAGDTVEGHAHNFDHTTVVYKGAVRVARTLSDGTVQQVDLVAPAHCLILAGVEHQITALAADSIFWCIYSHRTPQGEVVEEVTGWTEAYR